MRQKRGEKVVKISIVVKIKIKRLSKKCYIQHVTKEIGLGLGLVDVTQDSIFSWACQVILYFVPYPL